ncbi:DUF397 domain-containing protein [Streptomyces sp. NPDC093149]|uniref:DUF397 domain-containing protein n=1 Tax=Streptomyces sp. NPDC093149 TaxID=3366031 RepID=UPI00382F5714
MRGGALQREACAPIGLLPAARMREGHQVACRAPESSLWSVVMDEERAHWFKSSYSGGSGTECVEVAELASAIGIRDSKCPEGPRVAVQRSVWTEFVRGLQHHT